MFPELKINSMGLIDLLKSYLLLQGFLNKEARERDLRGSEKMLWHENPSYATSDCASMHSLYYL